MKVRSDRELIKRIGTQDITAFDTLYLSYAAMTKKLLLVLLGGNEEQADDANQDTWEAVWACAWQYDGGSEPKAWLNTIARHRAQRIGRDLGRRRRPLGVPPSAPLPQESRALLMDLVWALEQLPEAQRIVLLAGALDYDPDAPDPAVLAPAPSKPVSGRERTLRYRARQALLVLLAMLKKEKP